MKKLLKDNIAPILCLTPMALLILADIYPVAANMIGWAFFILGWGLFVFYLIALPAGIAMYCRIYGRYGERGDMGPM